MSEQIQRQTRLSLVPEPRPENSLDGLLKLRKEYRSLVRNLGKLNDHLIQRCLAGRLDTTGHHVEVREKVIGGEIIKILLVDGKG